MITDTRSDSDLPFVFKRSPVRQFSFHASAQHRAQLDPCFIYWTPYLALTTEIHPRLYTNSNHPIRASHYRPEVQSANRRHISATFA